MPIGIFHRETLSGCGLILRSFISRSLGALARRVGMRSLAQRDRARHTNLGSLDRRVLGAVAAEVKDEIGLDRDANIGADIVFKLEPQRGWLCRFRRNDMQRQNDVIAVTDRAAAGAVRKSLGRRPQHVHRFDVFGTGKIEHRRRSGVAGVAPIGLPSGIESDLDAGAQESSVVIFAHRTRDEARGAMSLPIPVRSVLRGRGRRGRKGHHNGGPEHAARQRDRPHNARGHGRSCVFACRDHGCCLSPGGYKRY
jgi:hypothetical protein